MNDSLALNKLKAHLAWFPPAESKIAVHQIMRCLLPARRDLSEEIARIIGPCFYRLAESGRGLLYRLLKALKHHSGKQRTEVLVPGYTCYSVAAAVAKAGLTIRVYDLDPKNFNPDMVSLNRAASEKTLAILSQHLFGIPSSLTGIVDVAKTTGAIHIEDAAQALGGFCGGQPLGMTGEFGLFSFGRGKPLPLGCGGMLAAKDADRIRSIDALPESRDMSRVAMTAAVQLAARPMLYGIAEALPLHLGETHFEPDFSVDGIPKLIRRLLTNTLPNLDQMNSHRRNIAAVYHQSLKPDLTFEEPEGGKSVYTRFPVRVSKNIIPSALKQRGVRHMYPKALVDEKIIRPYLSKQNQDSPGARQIADTLLTLPTHLGINKGEAVLTAQKMNDLMVH